MKTLITKIGLMLLIVAFAIPSMAQSDSSTLDSTEQDAIEEALEEALEEVQEELEDVQEGLEEVLEEVQEEIEKALKEIEEAEEEIEEAEEEMEEAQEEMEEDMEEAEEEMEEVEIEVEIEVEDSGEHVIIEDDKVQIVIREKDHGHGEHIIIEHKDHDIKKKKHKIVTTDWFNMQLGLNNALNTSGNLEMPEAYSNMEINSIKSIDFHLHFVQQALNLYQEHIRIIYGVGIDFNNYHFDNDIRLGKDANGVLVATDVPDVEYRKNKLATQYLTAPLMLSLQFGERRNKFKVSAGANFGYLINSYQRLKWRDNGKQSSRIKNNFNLEKVRLGYEVQVGYNNFHLYAKYFPNSMFKTDKGPELRSVSAGILIGSI